MNRTKVSAPSLEHVKALMELSNFGNAVKPERIERLVKKSPDPETIIQAFLEEFPFEDSPALQRKWRKALTELWAKYHPQTPLLPQLPLTQEQIIESYQLYDAVKFIQAVTHHPARLVRNGHELLLDPDEAFRIAKTLPSLESALPAAVETEWAVPHVRRLRAVLETARLIRPYKGRLVPVRSRLSRFMELTSVQQFFILWHVDVYHVDWPLFSFACQPYVSLLQDYLPLLWEVSRPARAHAAVSRRAWSLRCIQAFTPIWEEMGLIAPAPARSFSTSLFYQHTLPVVLDQVVLHDIFARYGLIGFTSSGDFVWTELGEALMKSEHSGHLPCASRLLN